MTESQLTFTPKIFGLYHAACTYVSRVYFLGYWLMDLLITLYNE
jgi:hypothetical protein